MKSASTLFYSARKPCAPLDTKQENRRSSENLKTGCGILVRKETNMPRPRDSQRSRVYKAESVWKNDPVFDDWTTTTEYVHRVATSAWFCDKFGIRIFQLHDGRGCRMARGGGDHLTLPRWSRNRQVILHELAHCVTARTFAAHGREFCANYLLLVRHFIGVDRHDQLRASFREHKVRYRPKRASSSSGNSAALAAWRLSQQAAAVAS